MRKQDAVMFGLYVVALALGVQMVEDGHSLGWLQIIVIAVLAPLRAYIIWRRP